MGREYKASFIISLNNTNAYPFQSFGSSFNPMPVSYFPGFTKKKKSNRFLKKVRQGRHGKRVNAVNVDEEEWQRRAGY